MAAAVELRQNWEILVERLLAALPSGAELNVSLAAERSHFVRFNQAKVRQAGVVDDAGLGLKLYYQGRSIAGSWPFSGSLALDQPRTLAGLKGLEREILSLPEDPYQVRPVNQGSSEEIHEGRLLPEGEVADRILISAADLDLCGLYAGGTNIRASANSAGQRHWFENESFTWDYTLAVAREKMLKGVYAGSVWDEEHYQRQLADDREKLKLLARPEMELPRGPYRSFFAPRAVAGLLGMFSWDALSEAALQRGASALQALRAGEQQLSQLFSLRENFAGGLIPRFNDDGELAPRILPLIEKGRLENTLVCSRSAKEYGRPANGAATGEYLRSPELLPGTLKTEDILAQLGEGLYVSDLWYLNWSDRAGARVTGMTRFACFWVAEGAIVAPIRPLRFDDTLYNLCGAQLEALTAAVELIPAVDTCDLRSLGGARVPGLLAAQCQYTL